jgi:hypothetical protein
MLWSYERYDFVTHDRANSYHLVCWVFSVSAVGIIASEKQIN